MKKALIIGLCILFLLPAILYSGIVIANNAIAKDIERTLKEAPLPEDTVLLDSISIAGKLVGNGNGMQYMGSILIISDLSAEELQDFYGKTFENVQVRQQKTPMIDFINTNTYSFELYGDPNHSNHYSITCWESAKDAGASGWIATLLNLDLRGH